MTASLTANYCDMEKIAEGTFGEVIKCHPMAGDQQGKWIVLKILKLSSIEDKSLHKRLVKRAELMKKFDFWSVVKLYNYIHDKNNDVLYLEMEYCPDGNLALAISEQKAKHRPFNEDQIREWFSQLVLAVQTLHEHFHLIHREIRPSKILFLNNKTVVKLADARISRVLNEYQATKGGGVQPDTTQYMSPQALKVEKANFTDDIWSFGVLLFELATLKLPDSYEIVEYLLQQGANVNEKNDGGRTAIYFAKSDEVKHVLKKYGAIDN